MTATMTLSGLTPGSYTVAGSAARAPGMVFEAQGDLWIGTDGSLGVVELTPS